MTTSVKPTSPEQYSPLSTESQPHQGVYEIDLPNPSDYPGLYPEIKDGEVTYSTERTFRNAPELIAQFGDIELPRLHTEEKIRDNDPVAFVVIKKGEKLYLPEFARDLAPILGLSVQSFDTPDRSIDSQFIVSWFTRPADALAESGNRTGWHVDKNAIVATFGVAGTEYILDNPPAERRPEQMFYSNEDVDESKFWRAPTNSITKKRPMSIHRDPELDSEEMEVLKQQGEDKRVVITVNVLSMRARIDSTPEAIAQSLVFDTTDEPMRKFALKGILADKMFQEALLEQEAAQAKIISSALGQIAGKKPLTRL